MVRDDHAPSPRLPTILFTVRRGTVSEEDGPSQTAAFDEGLYFNAGPMRISHHHETTLAYCRELQVPVEVFVADTDNAHLYQTRSATLSGRPIRLREARTDFDGYIAELLSKALSQAQLDQPLTPEDRDRLLAYLRRLGALDQQRQYRGSLRRGPDEQGRPSAPLPLRDLLGANLDFYVGIDWSSQPTMMQVVGGMDRLPAALAARLGNRIVYRAAVREIRQSERGVWATYADAEGRVRRVDADHCVSTIPLPVLSGLQKDLSQPVQSAIAAAGYDGGPARSACSSSAGSGKKTTRSTAADPGPTRRSAKSSIRRTASAGAKVCSSATTWISRGPCATAHPRNVSSSRSSKAPACTAVHGRVRNGVLGVLASRSVEPRLMEGRDVRGASSTRAASRTRWPGVLCRRLHDRHELVDAGCLRVGPGNGDGHARRALPRN